MDIDLVSLTLPAGFDNAGDLALTGQFAETDTAHPEAPQESAGAAAEIATVVSPHFELGLFLLLIDQTFLRHGFS
jgi:hypothetical protein